MFGVHGRLRGDPVIADVWVVLDATGGADCLYGVFTTEALAEAHAKSLKGSGEFFVEKADLLGEPMFAGEVAS